MKDIQRYGAKDSQIGPRRELKKKKKNQLDILEEVGFKEKTSMAISDSRILKSLKHVTEQTPCKHFSTLQQKFPQLYGNNQKC